MKNEESNEISTDYESEAGVSDITAVAREQG